MDRNMKKIIAALTLVILLFGCSGSSDNVSIDVEALRAYVLAKMVEYQTPGIQVCVKDNKKNETIKISVGVSNLDTMAPMTDDTQLRVGSNTKSFTALGVLRLEQEGLIRMTDEIGQYVNIESEVYQHITIQQLMNMVSGLKCYVNDDDSMYILNRAIEDPSRGFTPEELIAYGFKITDEQGMLPGDVFHYTNTNYILLGMVIEQASGLSYTDFIRREFTEPLGLSATYIPIDNNYGANVSGGYHIDKNENTTTDFSQIDLSYVWSAGAVISTASDLCEWMTRIGTDQIVSGETLTYVYIGARQEQGEGQYTSGLINEPAKIWHNGLVLGSHGEMCYLKGKGMAIAVLTNCTLEGFEGDPVRDIMDEIIRMVNEETGA